MGRIERLGAFVGSHDTALVVMKSSSGIGRIPFFKLWADAIGCDIVSPRSGRDFAKAAGHLEKTDHIDAQVIAHFAIAKAVVPTPPPSQNQQRPNDKGKPKMVIRIALAHKLCLRPNAKSQDAKHVHAN